MSEQTRSTMARHGAGRLVVLALTLIGFLAMHGMASADSGPSHCAAPDALIAPAGSAGRDMPGGGATAMADGHRHLTAASTLASPGTTPSDQEVVTSGCLLALLGALLALVLRLVRSASANTAPTPVWAVPLWSRCADAATTSVPVLCVIRL